MELTNFLTSSSVAKKVKLPGRIVIHRGAYSLSEIASMKQAGEYRPISREEEVCELEVNGVVIARGKIVKKAGDYFFKVMELNKEVTL
ncbi:MAG: hypothetical protein JXJ04_08805 [Spirochaetales bacterium]|nr:hypothetical protein [Spirochaetales bacterium]